MKNIIYLIVLIIAASFLLASCGEDNSTTAPTTQETNKVSINGGGYTNLSLTPFLTAAAYYSALNMTGVGFWFISGSDSLNLLIYTPGQSTGTFQWQTAGTYAVFLTRPAGKTYRNTVNSGTTVLTSYGSVGLPIEGNFSGTVVNIAPPGDTITVSCNKFSVTRSLE